MAITNNTYAEGTSLSGNSTAVTLPDGKGAIQIASASSLVSTIEFSLDGGTTWDVEKDNTSITADGVYSIDLACEGLVRVAVSSGTCSYFIKAGKRY